MCTVANEVRVGERLASAVLVGAAPESCRARANPTGLPKLVVAEQHQAPQLEHKKQRVL